MSPEVSTTPVPCDLVAFMAHPDDAEITCGGTLALAAEQGHRTAVVDFTRGELSSRGTPEIRRREADEASGILGLTCRVNLEMPDGHLHDGDEPRRRVVELIRRMRPRVVITLPVVDHHADHEAVAAIVSRSFHLSGVRRYLPDLEPWRPRFLLHTVGARPLLPDLVVDISSVHAKRKAAMEAYRSQFHGDSSETAPTRISDPEFIDWIEGGLRRFGFFIGASYGEGFTCAEPVPVYDVVQQLGRDKWEARRRS